MKHPMLLLPRNALLWCAPQHEEKATKTPIQLDIHQGNDKLGDGHSTEFQWKTGYVNPKQIHQIKASTLNLLHTLTAHSCHGGAVSRSGTQTGVPNEGFGLHSLRRRFATQAPKCFGQVRCHCPARGSSLRRTGRIVRSKSMTVFAKILRAKCCGTNYCSYLSCFWAEKLHQIWEKLAIYDQSGQQWNWWPLSSSSWIPGRGPLAGAAAT